MSDFLPENRKQKTMMRFQGMLGVFFGLLYMIIAGAMYYMMATGRMENGVFDIGKGGTYAVIVVFLLYGGFRLGRAVHIFKKY